VEVHDSSALVDELDACALEVELARCIPNFSPS
jgi:hypothetical protein